MALRAELHLLGPRQTRIIRGIVLLTAAATGGLDAVAEGHLWAGLALALGGSAYVAMTTLARAAVADDSPHHMALAAVDLLMITAIVWVTGGVHSEYYLLYYGPILYAALRLQVRDGIAASVLAAVLYLFVAMAGPGRGAVVTTAPLRVLAVAVSAAIMVIFFALLRQEAAAYESLRNHLHDSLRRVSAVYDVAHAANIGAGLSAVLSVLLEQSALVTGADRGAIALLASRDQLQLAATLGPDPAETAREAVAEPALRALAAGTTVTLDENGRAAGSGAGGVARSVYVPLVTPGGSIGVLTLHSRPSRKLRRAHQEFLAGLCSEAATAIENVQLRAQLYHLASTDHLTGLCNRREIERLLGLEADRAHRYRRPMTLVLMDIDNLKHVNDCHGHSVGDQVLSALGRMLITALRSSDRAGRMGGDEFLVVLPESDECAGAALADRIREGFSRELRELAEWRELAIPVGLSAGVAGSSEGDMLASELLARADQALYTAKRTGRNRTCMAEVGGAVAAERAATW